MADYTSTANVKAFLGVTTSTDDTLIGQLVTRMSRFVDTYTSRDGLDHVASVTESGRAIIDRDGHLLIWPRRPPVNSVASFSYRASPDAAWTAVDSSLIEIDGKKFRVIAWTDLRAYRDGTIEAQIVYDGGYSAIPDDVEQATIELVKQEYLSRKRDQNLTAKRVGDLELRYESPSKATVADMNAIATRMLDPYRRVENW